MQDGTIKPIQTIYDGYHFRSRGEARFAVFLNHLGIRYEYEKEGYAFEGVAYLPDFWLPDLDCFVEIKGQDTEDFSKARLLALYTGKTVYTFIGPLDPKGNCELTNYGSHPPRMWKYRSSDHLGGDSTEKVEVALDIMILRQWCSRAELEVDCDEDGNIILTINKTDWQIHEFSDYLSMAQDQQMVFKQLQKWLPDRKEEILDAFIPDEGWEYDFFPADTIDGYYWAECEECRKIEIYLGLGQHVCKPGARIKPDTPRLLAAFAAARQARFEHGEKPKGRQQ